MNDGQRDRAENAPWGEYRRLILGELDRISKDIREVKDKIESFRQEDVADMRTDIALLKFQAAFYGAIAGFVATAIVTLAIKLIHA